MTYFNAQSLTNKFANFEFLLSSKQYDIILVTETWLSSNINDSFVCSNNFYNIFRCDRNKKKGGGVAAFLDRSITCFSVNFNAISGVDMLVIDIFSKNNGQIRIILVYIPPQLTKKPNIMIALCNELTMLSSVNYNVIICGDFNMPGICWSDMCSANNVENIFLDFVISSNLCQNVRFPTRGANILDLVLTNNNFVKNIKSLPPFQSSDS